MTKDKINPAEARLAREFPKKCGCGRVYETREAWSALEWAYHYSDAFARFEARHCLCRSTLMIVVEVIDLDAE